MKRVYIIIFLFLFIKISTCFSEAKRILILQSYHKSEWTDNVLDGVDSVISLRSHKYDIFIDYLDTKKKNSEYYNLLLKKIFKLKYKNENFDLVITADDNALNFVINNYKYLFNNSYVVFCGINYFDRNRIKNIDKITGIVEYVDLSENLNLAFKLYPETKKIFLITDSTKTGQINKKEFFNVLSRLNQNISLVSLENLDFDYLEDILTNLPQNSIVFYMSFWKDKSGNLINPYKVADVLLKSNKPVFGRSRWMVGNGVLGGKCDSAYMQGYRAALIAKRILEGEDIKKIPIEIEVPDIYTFDYNLVKKYNIPFSKLPENSEFKNEPISFIKIKKYIVIGVIIFILLNILYIIFLIFNIKNRKRLEYNLEQSEKRYREFFNTANDAIFIYSPKTGAIIDLNRTACKMYNCTYEEILKANFSDFSVNDENFNSCSVFQKLKKTLTEGPQLFEWKSRKMTGEFFWTEVHLQKSRILDQDVIIAIVRDISERKKIEEDKKRSEELFYQNKKMEAIGNLAGGIAHDFNNILTSIIGNTELLRMDEAISGDMQDELDEIYTSAKKASNLTHQLLEYTKRQVTKPRVINLNEIVQNMYKMISRIVGENIHLQLQLTDENLFLYADPIQIEQIIMNLIINARDAINSLENFEKKNKIVISTSIFDKENNSSKYMISLSVKDTGIGIKKEIKDKIFDPFFTTKDSDRGTGLGLSIVYRIVKEMGGDIDIESEEEKGAKFKLFFPYDKTLRQESGLEEKIGCNKHTNAKILLVEDDFAIKRVTEKVLLKNGYDVFTESNGEVVLQKIATQGLKFDLLITDVIMPDMNGKELSDKIVVLLPGIKILFVSGYPADHIATKGVIKENVNFLHKPYDIEELIKKIEKILSC